MFAFHCNPSDSCRDSSLKTINPRAEKSKDRSINPPGTCTKLLQIFPMTCLLGCLYSLQLIICVCHTVRVKQFTAVFLLWFFSFSSLRPLCPVQYVSLLLSSLLPSTLLSSLSSSLGCVWWTDVIICTSFIPPSSKEGDDCIYQALVCLRDASGTVVLHSQSKQSSAGKRRKPLCVFDRLTNW